jgi:glyoxylase-like metal-dependent hydrolase (beta-lactamase superfamily II)
LKLMQHLYQVGGISLSHRFDASAYLLEGDRGLFLLDCGTPDGFGQICANLAELGFSPADVQAVYGTHGHYDHVGAAALWKKQSGAKLFLHRLDAPRVESGDAVKTTASLLYGRDFPACAADGFLEDGQKINFGNQISMEVLHTPGHTPGSVCFALDCAGYRFLVAGDTLWGGFSSLTGSDEAQWRQSLHRLTQRHFDGYTFGHVGANVIADADARILEAEKQFGVYYNPWFKAMKDTFRYA